MYTESEVLDFVNEEDVKFIRLAFFSPDGKQKNISIMASELENAFKKGINFDASSIKDFQSADKSDLYLHPDPSTLSVIPWRPTNGKVVRMFCDIKYPDGKPYEKDCRYLLKTAVKKAESLGIKIKIGCEIEFYLFKLDEEGNATKIPFDNAGYMDIAPEDKGENIRRDICFTLEQMGIRPEASHHEEGPGQNEIDFYYDTPLSSADNTATFKWIVRTKAQANGLYADFTAKPLENKSGNGMHISLYVKDSKTGRDYTKETIAGILKHIEEISLFLNPTENSYQRLGECKAPKYITWAKENRSTLIRIPAENEEQRVELRSPDPEANPYIAFTLLIHAALDGIQNKLEVPESTEKNLFEEENCSANLKKLPDTIEEAKSKASETDFVKNILGESFFSTFIK